METTEGVGVVETVLDDVVTLMLELEGELDLEVVRL